MSKAIHQITDQDRLDSHFLENRVLRKNVKKYREAQGLTQRDLAKKADVQPYQVSYIENSNYYNPKWETLTRIAVGLGVRFCDLVCEK